jgi:hypothetical protein
VDFLTGIIPSSSSSASVSPVGFLVGFFLGLGAGMSLSEEKEVVTDSDLDLGLEGRESGIWKGFFLIGCLRSSSSSVEMVPDWNFLGFKASGTLNVLLVGLVRRSASGSSSGTGLPFDFRGGGISIAFFGAFV